MRACVRARARAHVHVRVYVCVCVCVCVLAALFCFEVSDHSTLCIKEEKTLDAVSFFMSHIIYVCHMFTCSLWFDAFYDILNVYE